MLQNKSPLKSGLIKVPQGGGAVKGLGEAFQPNLNLGTGSYVVPLELPKGFRQRTPKLSLSYNTGGSQGPLGLGWTLPLLSIRRSTESGVPHYNEQDAFLLGNTPLLPMGNGRYRPAIDEQFQRILRLGQGWEITEKDGTRYLLGISSAGRIGGPQEAGTFAWLIEEEVDTTGNRITYQYLEDGENYYLEQIDYAIYRVQMHYEERPDVLSDRSSGRLLTTRLRCSRIELHRRDITPSLLRSFELIYQQAPLAGHSLLSEIRLSGFTYESTDSGVITRSQSAPPLSFSYTAFEPQQRQLQVFDVGADAPPLPGDGLAEVVDLDGFGLPGILQSSDTSHRYWSNAGGYWRPSRKLRNFPRGASLGRPGVRLADMDGNARADLLVSDGPLTGYYPGLEKGGWGTPVVYRQRPNFSAREANVRLVDADGDGSVDALRSSRKHLTLFRHRREKGWDPNPRALPRRREDDAFPDLDFRDPRVRSADMTGEGVLSWARVFRRFVEYWPGLGELQWDNRQIMTIPGPYPDRFRPERCFLIDADGDGRSDLLYIDGRRIFLWINRSGASFSPPIIIEHAPFADLNSVRVGDFMGTGTAGLLFSSRQAIRRGRGLRYLDFTGGVKPYLLNRIDNHVGGITELEYGVSTAHYQRDRDMGNAWPTFLPFPVPVVNRIIKTDQTTGARLETEIRYHDGHFDGRRRKFLGFTQVETIERTDTEGEDRLTQNFYYRGVVGEAPGLDPDQAAALAGKLLRAEIFGLGDAPESERPYRTESAQWHVDTPEVAQNGRSILVPQLQQRRIEHYERQTQARVQEWTYEYDVHGNLTRETKRGYAPGADTLENEVITTLNYALHPELWILNLASERILTDGSGNLLGHERFYYDGRDINGLPLGQVTTGLLRRHARLAYTQNLIQSIYGDVNAERLNELGYQQLVEPDGTVGYWVNVRRVSYNAQGNMVAVVDPHGQTTSLSYDPSGLFPILMTNALGHTRSATYDPWLGTIRSLTHWGGNTNHYTYTPLGHVETEIKPGDSEAFPTVRFTYRFEDLPISTVMERRRRSGEDLVSHSVTYYDGLGEELQRRAQTDNGNFVVSGLNVRDLRGDTIRQEPPFFSLSEQFDDSEQSTEEAPFLMTYDAMARMVLMRREGGHESRVVHGLNTVDYYDPEDSDPTSPHYNSPARQEIDSLDRIVGLVEQGDTGTIRTGYRRDPLGRITAIEDPGGNSRIAHTFDLMGRKVRIVHLDAGTRTFLFNARGQMAEYRDARNRRVNWIFDPLGRVLEVRVDGISHERFTYDTGPGNNLQTRLARVEDTSGATVFSYDERGRVAEVRRSFNGLNESFTYSITYDPDDRILNTTYPDGHSVSRTYNARGLLQTVSGFIDDIRYDVRSRRTRVQYAQGVMEQFTYYPDLGTPETHRIRRSRDNELLYGRRYTYDRNNHLASMEDLRSANGGYRPINKTYTYDLQYRLRQVRGNLGSELISLDYAYDDLGNMTLNSETGPEALSHNGMQLSGPIIGGSVEQRYTYDANGCVQQRPGQSLAFDARQLLRSVTLENGLTLSFDYDHRGRRVRKQVDDGNSVRETFYIGEIFDVRPDGNTARYVSTPKSETRLVTVGNGQGTLLLSDIQGHIILAVATGGQARARREYMPYGRDRLNTGSTSDFGFGGRLYDPETGLYYFRRRYYDPEAGRFLSPDLFVLFRAESLVNRPRAQHLYIFGNNNPVTFVDPSGLLSIGFWEGLAIFVIAALIVAGTILSAGALAPLLGVSAGLMYGIAAGAIGAGIITGAIIGGVQGGAEGALLGMMLGISVVATVFIGAWFYGSFLGFGAIAGFAIAGTLGGIQAAAFIPAVRQSDAYKAILGWSSWINPYAWPGIALGLIVFVADFFATVIAGNENDEHMLSLGFDARYGVIQISSSNFSNTGVRGFNIGTFVWLTPSADAGTPSHEGGHALNNALFGIFQVSNIFSGDNDSLWEIMAENNTDPDDASPEYGFDELDWWGTSPTPSP